VVEVAQRSVRNRYGDNDLLVFIEAGQPDAVPRIRQALLLMAQVEAIDFVSQSEAGANFRCLFADEPEIPDAESVDASVLPPSFRLEVAGDPVASAAVIRKLPGVREVVERPSDASIVLRSAMGMLGPLTSGADCTVTAERIK
jgi:hypothetical protein